MDSAPWHAIFQHNPVAMAFINFDGEFSYLNEAFTTLLGVSLEPPETIRYRSIVRPEDQRRVDTYVDDLTSGRLEELAIDQGFVLPDGSETLLSVRFRTLRNDGGTSDGIVATFAPSSRRSVADVRFRHLLRAADAFQSTIDIGGNLLESSGGQRQDLGYPAAFWETANLFDVVIPEDLPTARSLHEEVTSAVGGRAGGKLRARAADGSVHELMVHALNLVDDPEVGGIVVTAFDLTGRRASTSGMTTAAAVERDPSQQQAARLAAVSHELRNPLHALQGLAELLAGEALPPRASDLAATLSNQLAGLADITSDLLDSARVAAGELELFPEAVNLRALIADVASYGRISVGPRPVGIHSWVHPDVPEWVEVDRSRLRQVLRNLVGNAVKFTADGAISLLLEPAGSRLLFTVSDTGEGIAAEVLPNIFDPFTRGSFDQGSRGARATGAGLGLSIVQQLVVALGGTVVVSSSPGAGSTFTVELALPAAAAPGTAPTPGATPGDGPRARALVVEDNPVNQLLARSQLERLGLDATVVGSGEAALALFDQPDAPTVDVILMDLQLPGIDGLETMRQLRRRGAPVAAIPVVCITASASADDRATFLAAGMDGFVSKPATLADLRAAVTRVLRPLPTRRSGPPSAPRSDGSAPGSGPELRDEPSATDRSALSTLMAEFGDMGAVRLVVRTYLQELTRLGPALTRDRPERARTAHTLKSSSRLVGAITFARLCQEIEDGLDPDRELLERTRIDTAAELELWLSADRPDEIDHLHDPALPAPAAT